MLNSKKLNLSAKPIIPKTSSPPLFIPVTAVTATAVTGAKGKV